MCLTKLNKNKNHSQGRKDRYQQMMLTSQYYQYVQSGGRKSFEEFKNSSSVNNAVHGMLDLAGLLFDAADAINAAWYAAEGDYENAGISGMGIIPVIGIGKTDPRVAKTTKNMFKAGDVIKASEKSIKLWNAGSFKSSEASLEYHFKRHGKEVGAENVDQYARKAFEFSKTVKKGATKSHVDGATAGVIRYKKNGKYIDLAPDGTIVSFGKQ